MVTRFIRSIKVLIYWLIVTGIFIAGCEKETAKDADQLLFVPDDLEVTLWAEAPMFFNPTNIDIDSKGRVWVTEAVNYRNYNNDSTKALHHKKGDRVMILEDTDEDGKADRSKMFVQDKDLISPLGIAVIGNKVYVSCSPNLIVFTDVDGDDKPDTKEIFLTGFGGKDHDHSLHAIVGGPDGNLYFNTGNAGPHVVTDKSGWTLRSGSLYTGGSPYNTVNQGNTKSDDGKVWIGGLGLKISPEGKGLAVIGHNFRNAFELTIDSRGDVWQNDNDDQVVACRTTWLMEGGNAGYFSTDGTRYWQADQRPGQDIFTAHWHQEDPGVIPAGDNTGAGSPTGIVMNESDALGDKYQGMLLSADAGRNVIFAYQPVREKSGYALGKRNNLITSLAADNEFYVWNDSLANTDKKNWFRPSDVAIGTEGAIYIADWYDPVVGGHQMADSLGYGRIYRISPKNKKLIHPTIDLTTIEGMVEAVRNPAVNVRFDAYQKLIANGEPSIPEVKKLLNAKNQFHRARGIWLLSGLGEKGKVEVVKFLNDKDEEIRAVAFRALRKNSDNIVPYAQKLAGDASAFVRREITQGVSAYDYNIKKPIISELLKNYDATDRWYLEAIGNAVTGHENEFMTEVEKIYNPENNSPDLWNEQMEALVWRLHPASYIGQLASRAQSDKLSGEQRRRSMTAIAFINDKRAAQAMVELTKNKTNQVSELARYWVSFRQGNDWFTLVDLKKSGIDPGYERNLAAMKGKMMMVKDEHISYGEKKWIVRDMARDPIGGNMIITMVFEKTFPKDLFEDVGEIILNNPDLNVRTQASQYFTNGVAKRDYSIPTIAKSRSDNEKGAAIFTEKCGSCHRVGDNGKDIGPELTQIKKKFDTQALLDAIVNPSAGIVFGYEAWTIITKDGQSHFGFLVADGKEVITIKDLNGTKHNISIQSISSRKKSEKSLMPGASSLGLADKDLADIAGYLTTLK